MIRLRKVSALYEIRAKRAPLYYWSLAAGFITTAILLTTGYHLRKYQAKLRTKAAIEKGEVRNILTTDGLSRTELEKAVALLEKQKRHEEIQRENYERYKKLRDKRREQEGLG